MFIDIFIIVKKIPYIIKFITIVNFFIKEIFTCKEITVLLYISNKVPL